MAKRKRNMQWAPDGDGNDIARVSFAQLLDMSTMRQWACYALLHCHMQIFYISLRILIMSKISIAAPSDRGDQMTGLSNKVFKMSMASMLAATVSGLAAQAVMAGPLNLLSKADKKETSAAPATTAELEAADGKIGDLKHKVDQAQKQLDASKAHLKAAQAELRAAQADREALALRTHANALASEANGQDLQANTKSLASSTIPAETTTAPVPGAASGSGSIAAPAPAGAPTLQDLAPNM